MIRSEQFYQRIKANCQHFFGKIKIFFFVQPSNLYEYSKSDKIFSQFFGVFYSRFQQKQPNFSLLYIKRILRQWRKSFITTILSKKHLEVREKIKLKSATFDGKFPYRTLYYTEDQFCKKCTFYFNIRILILLFLYWPRVQIMFETKLKKLPEISR